VLGRPTHIHPLGKTEIPRDVIQDHLEELKDSHFKGVNYDLLNHNCNHFSQEFANFLVGESIPDYILNLSETVKET
jgi:hypothetical protein